MGNIKRASIAALAGMLACASHTQTFPPDPPKANPCATPGATYLDHFAEQSGGTCGPIPDVIININKDGTLAGSGSGTAPTCQSNSGSGCTVKLNNCTSTNNGVTCTITTDVTFAADGSSASGLETLSCSGSSSSCTSTYKVTATRQ